MFMLRPSLTVDALMFRVWSACFHLCSHGLQIIRDCGSKNLFMRIKWNTHRRTMGIHTYSIIWLGEQTCVNASIPTLFLHCTRLLNLQGKLVHCSPCTKSSNPSQRITAMWESMLDPFLVVLWGSQSRLLYQIKPGSGVCNVSFSVCRSSAILHGL